MKSSLTELKEKISEVLQKERCLVVIDNVEYFPFDLLEIIPLPVLLGEGNGSRVIIMLRSTYRVDHFRNEYKNNPSLSYKLKPLEDDHAWDLFSKKIRLPDYNVQSSDLDKIKGEIIDVCGGNPEAIMVLGRFLSTKKSYEEWLTVLEQLSGSDFFASISVYVGLVPYW